MAIQWEDQYRLGEPLIDKQHEDIFDQFNRLSKALEEGGGSEEVTEILNFLDRYSSTHFSDEENLMMQHNYDGLEEQRQQHGMFRDNIETFIKLLATGSPDREIAIKIDAELIRYFINHIRKLDWKMVDTIKGLKD